MDRCAARSPALALLSALKLIIIITMSRSVSPDSYAKLEKVGACAFFQTNPTLLLHGGAHQKDVSQAKVRSATKSGICCLAPPCSRALRRANPHGSFSTLHAHTIHTHTEQARTASCTRRKMSPRTRSSRSRRSGSRRRTRACRARPSARSRSSRSSRMTISSGEWSHTPLLRRLRTRVVS